MSGHGTIETAVKATKLGAYDFVEKPLSLEKTLLVVERALEHARLERENRQLRERIERAHEIIGTQPRDRRAPPPDRHRGPDERPRPDLRRERRGQGAGRAGRPRPLRAARPAVRGGQLRGDPDELIESELFGHEKGAFTGAMARRRGKFELATGGTIFLDEIGDMSLRPRPRCPRALEEQTVERIGGHEPIRVDVRVIAASNQALPDLIAQGRFREDLFYRLNVIPIEVPPLRRRREDIPLLVEHFLKTFSAEYGKRSKTLSGEAMGSFMVLRLAGQRARAAQHGRAARHHDARRRHRAGGSAAAAPSAEAVAVPAEAGLQSLREAPGRVRARVHPRRAPGPRLEHHAGPPQALGIGRVNLWRKLKAYGIAAPRKGEEPTRPDA